jgi:cyclopropane fatty-acyl-phospholipid synthase-like methyltransferase
MVFGAPLGSISLLARRLSVEAQLAVLDVATGAGLALLQAAGTAVLALALDPLDRRSARVEDVDVALGGTLLQSGAAKAAWNPKP